MKGVSPAMRKAAPPPRAARALHRGRRTEAHERQADHAASQFLRGEQGLGGTITPTPAANFHLPASAGLPLASSLRTDLESAFHADLSSVRIHRDRESAVATRNAQALAFASGSHIYLSADAPNTVNEGGRRLIAHEVAHVLQQTGRVGSGGVLRAVDRHGCGDVQRWDSPFPSTETVPEIVPLLGAHRDAVDTNDPARATIERLLRGYSAAQNASRQTFLDERSRHVLEDTVDPLLGDAPSRVPAAVASALYDFLKRAYLWGPAAKLLHMRRDLHTYFYSAETYSFYMENFAGGDFSAAKARFYHHWYTQPWFGSANPRFMLDRTLITLLGPTSAITEQNTKNGKPLYLAAREELKRLSSGELLEDELYFVTVRVAGEIDLIRWEVLSQAAGKMLLPGKEGGTSRAQAKATMAQRIRDSAAEALRTRKPEDVKGGQDGPARETFLLWNEDVTPALADLTQFAFEFWSSAILFTASLEKDLDIEGLKVSAKALLPTLDTRLPGYRAALEPFFHSLLDRMPDGTLPAPAQFASKRDLAVTNLDTALRRLERSVADRLFDALPQIRTEGQFSFDRKTADRRLDAPTRALIAWSFAWAASLRHLASRYSKADDEALRARQRAVADDIKPVPDAIHFIRVELAKALVTIGKPAGWSAWDEWGASILEARELINGTPMTSDYLAFGTDWTLDPESAPERMQADLPAMPHGFEPLSTKDVVELYAAADYRRLSEQINTLMASRGSEYRRTDVPILNEALKTAIRDENRRPKRFLIKQWRWVHAQPEPRQSGYELIVSHPLTRARVADESRQSGFLLYSVANPKRDGPLILWTAPSPVSIVERLQQLPEVNRALLAALRTRARLIDATPLRELIESGKGFRSASGGPPLPPASLEQITLPQLQALDWGAWWDLWQAVLAGYEGDARVELLKKMREATEKGGVPEELTRERKSADRQYRIDERRALIHERRRMVEVLWGPLLKNFEPFGHGTWAVPGGKRTARRLLSREASHALQYFMLLLPEDDRESHHAMAVLELADVLDEQLGFLTAPHEYYVWGQIIDRALIWANDANKGDSRAVRDTFAVESERGNDALFHARRDRLLKLLTHMSLVIAQYYQKWGVVGVQGDGTIENPGSVHSLGDDHLAVGRGVTVVHEGVTYEIVQVFEPFVFHPGKAGFASITADKTAGPTITVGGVTYDYLKQSRPTQRLMHVIVDGGPEVTEVHASDDPTLLTKLTWALHMYSTIQQLNQLGAAIETFGEVLMTAAELFPGGGQALAAARIVTTATMVITGDLPKIALDLITNPRKLLEAVWQRARQILSLENLLDYFLFSNYSLNGLLAARPDKRPDSHRNTTSSRRMRRLLHKLWTLAQGVGRVLARTQDSVQDRRQSAEHFVQSHPAMVPFVQFIADNYFLIAAIADRLSDDIDFEEALQAFKDPGSLKEKVDSTLQSLGEVELPAEILPLEDLIHAVIDMIGHRLGGKYRLGVKILVDLLDSIGALQAVSSEIAGGLRGFGLTTKNVFPFWETDVIPAIGDFFQKGQTEVRDTIESTFTMFRMPLGLAQPTAHVHAHGSEFPDPPADRPAALEGQPALEEDVEAEFRSRSGTGRLSGPAVAQLLNTIPAEPGQPLTPQSRALAEARFGQDFSDVRIHKGGKVASLARQIGARALTSGSHIALGEAALSGDETLYHELAHVIQQTGAHPPGKGSKRPPRRGRAGRGLRWNPVQEAQADAAAAAALRGNRARIGANADTAGWQPSLVEKFGQRFLHQLTDITAVEAEVEDIDKPKSLRLIGKDVRNDVAHVAGNLRELFHKNELEVPSSGPFHSQLEEISTHLLSNHAEITAAIEGVAIRASYQAAKAKDNKPARMALDVDDFTRRLERYIFGKTGILLNLKPDATKPPIGRKSFKNPRAPFRKAEVRFVFLPDIHGNSLLWQNALLYRGAAKIPIPQAEQANWRTRIRAVLRSLGPSTSIWVAGYRLSEKVFKAAEEWERLKQTGALSGTVPPGALPSATAYADTVAKGDGSPLGNLRLHLGTYADKDNKGPQRGTDRESHHITQYLLAEYFHNGASGKPETDSERIAFPLLPKHYKDRPYGNNLKDASGVPKSFGNVQIEEIELKRGGKMPTILLARGTHRSGKLHMTPSADDLNDTSPATQAATINRIYKKKLPEKQRELESDAVQNNAKYVEWQKYQAAHDVSGAISKAMQATYAETRDYMQRQLKTALAGIERDYYNELYSQANKSGKHAPMTRGAMHDVWKKAVDHNKVHMEKFGWTG